MMNQQLIDVSETSDKISCYTFGVGHHTEGVCLLLNLGKYRFLLDCGLNDFESLQKFDHQGIDFVFCSHAHQDHSRGLLKFNRYFPHIPVFTSEVTAKLLPLNWLDQNLDGINFCIKPLPFKSPLKITDDLSIELFPTGHLPGATAILIKYFTRLRTYNVFYTGDFCLSNLQLVEGLSLESLRNLSPDVLIIEASYGTARHPHRRLQEKIFIEKITAALQMQKNIILPVPTFGLGQEIIKLLRSHHQLTGKDIDIWVDGNIALACDQYLEFLDFLPQNVQNFAKHQPLFWDEKIVPRLRRVTKEIDRNQLGNSPCIVLTDNLSYLEEYCQNRAVSWLILASEDSKTWQSNLFKDFIRNFEGEKIKIEDYLLAEHSDGRNTTQLIHNLRPQHIIFVHGNPNYLADLTSLEELQNRYQLHTPVTNTLVDLPIGDRFLQPVVQPQNTYEGELNETGAFITITLPEQINRDSRWQNFADTGLIEARWQGEELVLRGLSQRELLRANNLNRRSLQSDCCGNCIFYQENCTNPNSPLYQFRVTPEGCCPMFEDKL